jgi:hypothetical protein
MMRIDDDEEDGSWWVGFRDCVTVEMVERAWLLGPYDNRGEGWSFPPPSFGDQSEIHQDLLPVILYANMHISP